MELSGRTVLLTGAAGGIGSAASRALVAAGARVVLVDSDGEGVERVARDLGDAAVAASADVTDLAALEAAVSAGERSRPPVSVVVANAATDAIAPIAEIDPEAFRRVVEVNLIGTFNTVRAALPGVVAQEGHVLLINSMGSVIPPPFQAAYAASKAGVGAFASSLRIELRGTGATVGQLYFGAIDTQHFRDGMAHPLMQRATRRIPKSFTQAVPPADAADAIVRSVRRRARREAFPRSNAAALMAPQLIGRMIERRISN